jgi:hypothetical protein
VEWMSKAAKESIRVVGRFVLELRLLYFMCARRVSDRLKRIGETGQRREKRKSEKGRKRKHTSSTLSHPFRFREGSYALFAQLDVVLTLCLGPLVAVSAS